VEHLIQKELVEAQLSIVVKEELVVLKLKVAVMMLINKVQ
jgi:hypothetical protein